MVHLHRTIVRQVFLTIGCRLKYQQKEPAIDGLQLELLIRDVKKNINNIWRYKEMNLFKILNFFRRLNRLIDWSIFLLTLENPNEPICGTTLCGYHDCFLPCRSRRDNICVVAPNQHCICIHNIVHSRPHVITTTAHALAFASSMNDKRTHTRLRSSRGCHLRITPPPPTSTRSNMQTMSWCHGCHHKLSHILHTLPHHITLMRAAVSPQVLCKVAVPRLPCAARSGHHRAHRSASARSACMV